MVKKGALPLFRLSGCLLACIACLWSGTGVQVDPYVVGITHPSLVVSVIEEKDH